MTTTVTADTGPRIVLWYASLARAKAIASRRYRMLHHAEVGANVKVVVAERLPDRMLDGADALVIIRPYPSRGVRRALDRCARMGVTRVADYDDLLFGGPAEERPEVVGGRLPRRWAEEATERYASILDHFDAFTVSTAPLADELRAVRPAAPVFVVPNGLSPSWVAQGRRIYPAWSPGDRRVMRFFPGSPTHDESFALVRPALGAFLERHRDVELELVGNLRFDASELAEGRVRHLAPVPFDHLPSLLAGAWVNLWPRVDSRFNRAKSPIKFLEAAAFGCPTVASTSCRTDGIDGPAIAFRDGVEPWMDALERWRDDDARVAAARECRRVADAALADRGWRALVDAVESLRRQRVTS